ncbi:MAG: nuclear transport factor 2 family protein [Chloroflexi bacterium]|nr:nuclear transport factor 2 family protein [Chloroflexota bacterium]
MTQNVDIEKQIVELERERLRAMINADSEALNSILSDDLTYIHTTTREDSKKSLIDSLASGRLSYKSMDTEGVRVRIYGDAAVVTGSAAIKVSSGGRLLEFSILFTDVYAKQEGRWQMVAWQSTRKPEE